MVDTPAPAPAPDAPKPEPTVLGTPAPKPDVAPSNAPKPDAAAEDKKPDGDKKPDDKTAAATVDPKAFKLPDGFTADEKQLGEFASIANELKLPQDAAQKFLDLHATALKQASETSSKFWSDKQAEWATQNKADFGPEPAKNPKIIAVSKMIDSLGEKPAAALKEALEFSGMGNNPAVIAAFAALAERLTEPGHAKGNPTSKPQDPATAFYPNMKQG